MRPADAGRRRRTCARRGSALVAPALALAISAGCAHRPPGQAGPPPPPPRPLPRAGYDAFRDSLAVVDTSALRGRRIVLDPGHGGAFAGAIGVGGLTEKDVNLGVALALRDLLVAQGAQVELTRDSDRDFVSPADSSLRTDLAARVAIADGFAPDLFVSIHHNADPGGAHDVNETRTYYKLGDEGPSYDAGQDVQRALTRNLGIETTRLLPGNFYVVRSVSCPALLTEASYVTYPPTEAKLRTGAAREIEARAIDLGIARFFARRAPVVDAFRREDAGGGADVRLAGRVRGAFDALDLRVDGARQAPLVVGDSIAWTPAAPLAGGPHTASLAARLSGEGASRAVALAFTLEKPPARLLAEFPGQPAWDGRSPLALRVRVLDRDGLPLADSLRVRVRAARAGSVVPADTLLALRDGAAWGYFRRPARAARGRAPGGALLVDLASAHGARPARARIELPPRGAAAVRAEFARAMPGDTALRDAPGTTGLSPAIAWLNRDGFVALAADARGGSRTPALPGFRAWDADGAWPPRFVAIAGGALRGRRIALDPEGGGDDAAGAGPDGTRAAALNLDVARALAAMLAAAGASVTLVRDGDLAVSEVERVQAAEAFGAERYVRIAHAATPPHAGHYFASAGGRRWAEALSAAMRDLGLADSLAVTESAKYPLAQTSAVALDASLARVDTGEDALLAPGRLRSEAYALYLATARDLAGGDASGWPLDSLRVLDAAGRPVAGAAVTLGGALVVATDAAGVARFARTESGPIEARVDDPRARVRTVLLESDRGRTLQAARAE